MKLLTLLEAGLSVAPEFFGKFNVKLQSPSEKIEQHEQSQTGFHLLVWSALNNKSSHMLGNHTLNSYALASEQCEVALTDYKSISHFTKAT